MESPRAFGFEDRKTSLCCASIIRRERNSRKRRRVCRGDLTRTLLSNMLFCPMGKRRKVTRLVSVMSPSARISLLNTKRQEIIHPAFERPREFVLLSVRALAHRLRTDPATMIRIVRGMQFDSY